MAERTIKATFKQRRDTSANWESKNPVLADGEMITVITNAGAIRHKTGDGVKTYTQLPFNDEPLYNALAKKCDASGAVEVTLLASNWNNREQTVTVEGLKANQNGIASLQQNYSMTVYEAVIAAQLSVVTQADNTLTFSYSGDAPKVDIPILVILLG